MYTNKLTKQIDDFALQNYFKVRFRQNMYPGTILRNNVYPLNVAHKVNVFVVLWIMLTWWILLAMNALIEWLRPYLQASRPEESRWKWECILPIVSFVHSPLSSYFVKFYTCVTRVILQNFLIAQIIAHQVKTIKITGTFHACNYFIWCKNSRFL